MTFNLWGEINNLKDLIIANEQIIVYGVFTSKRPMIQHEIQLYIKKNDDLLLLVTNKDFKPEYCNLYIKIKNKNGIIQINAESEIYSRSEYLILGLQLIYLLKIKECLFQDKSFILVNSLQYGKPYYMNFGFMPYYEKNMERVDMTQKLLKLFDKLYEIKWEDIDNVLKNNKDWEIFKEKYYNIPKPLSPFRSFVNYNENDFSFIFKNQIVEIPGLEYFREIKNILNSCKWINNDIHSYQPRMIK